MKKPYTKPDLRIVLFNSDTHILTSSDYKVNSFRNGGTTDIGDVED